MAKVKSDKLKGIIDMTYTNGKTVYKKEHIGAILKAHSSNGFFVFLEGKDREFTFNSATQEIVFLNYNGERNE